MRFFSWDLFCECKALSTFQSQHTNPAWHFIFKYANCIFNFFKEDTDLSKTCLALLILFLFIYFDDKRAAVDRLQQFYDVLLIQDVFVNVVRYLILYFKFGTCSHTLLPYYDW